MARARNIKPGFFKNEDLGTADPFVSLLFAGLWTLADKSGILEDRPLRIKAEIFPYRDNLDINGYLTVLVSFRLIHRYEANGVKLIQIAKFKEHQNPHHTEKDSVYPEYSSICQQSVQQPLNNGDTPADLLIPDSLNTDSLIPDSPIPDPLPATPVAPPDEPAAPRKKKEPDSAETWKAYSEAYYLRHKTEPVRNATVNAQMASFVKRIGVVEAPHVAAFYVTHNNAYYVRQLHPVKALLSDAEKLRTEWATRTQMTNTKAQQADRTQTNYQAFSALIAEAEEQEG
jgi:hypothetical protein